MLIFNAGNCAKCQLTKQSKIKHAIVQKARTLFNHLVATL